MDKPGERNLQHDENIGKSFVNEEGKATIVCPACNVPKIVSVGHLRERQHRVRLKCTCGHIFKINLDFRQCYRKPTKLSGTYIMHPPATGGGLANILNISLSGLCFQTRGIHKISQGQKGQIDFTLDNKKMTHLHKEFIIRTVNGNLIGCEFLKDSSLDRELGFYMRFGG